MLRGKGQILVVDDEANLRRVLSVQLEREGFEVHTAEDGQQATEVFRQHHVDLIISDLRMPKLDGMGLLRASMQDDPTRPVVIVTAHGTIDSAVEALKNGAFDFIRKPFDKEEVRRIVDKAMRTRELARGQAHRHASGDSSRFGIIGKLSLIHI